MRSCIRGAVLMGALLAIGTAHAQITVSDPWVRGTVQGQRATGAFMTLTAPSGATLVGASSPVAKIVEIHQTAMAGGVMQMRAIPRLDLPAGQPVTLAPGGYHVMLMALQQPLAAGQRVQLTLVFEDRAGKRSTVEVDAPVRPLTERPR